MSTNNTQRMGTMDDIRVVLTLLGVVLHAALEVAKLPRGLDEFNVWMWVDSSIHVFRMQIFFVISGYFGWKAVTRSDHLYKRTRQLLLPGVVSWFVICSLIKGHIQILHPTEGIDFYNIWFIFTLYLLVLGNWILYRCGILSTIVKFTQNNPVTALVMGFVLQVIINTVRSYVDVHFAWSFHLGIPQTLSLTVDYELYFLGGLLLSQIKQWRDILSHPNWGLVGMVAWMMWLWATYISPSIVKDVLFTTPVTILICLGIMSVATSSNVRIKGASTLCSSSLTIYLWHFPLIVMFDKFIRQLEITLPDPVMFVALCGVGLGGSLLIHQTITKFSVLQWMWLGNPWTGFKITNPFAEGRQTVA